MMNGEAMLIRPKPVCWKRKITLRKLLRQAVLWMSVAVIAILAVVAGIFALMITGIWQFADHILFKLEGKE